MGRFFSDTVETALRDIYYQMWTGRGQEAFQRLEQASAAGDGDASCLLARCYCGGQYVWEGHHFPEDDRKAIQLLHKSVEQGSALGVMVALRSRELPPDLQKKMPFSSLEEAFHEVLSKAEAGEPFCQYTVGNSYFWWDFLRIQGKKREDFSCAEFLALEEGLCVQCMHLGPYDAEPATIELMHEFAAREGYAPDFESGRLHHEIYLSDARRTAPEKLRTVIRHPVRGRN